VICDKRERWACSLADKLQLCIEARREVVKEEFEEHRLDDALDNLHLGVHSDKTSA